MSIKFLYLKTKNYFDTLNGAVFTQVADYLNRLISTSL